MRLLALTVLLCATACTGANYKFPEKSIDAAGECLYYECHFCTRAADFDFACRGHELFTQAWRDCGQEELCQPNAYGTYCCYPDSRVP